MTKKKKVSEKKKEDKKPEIKKEKDITPEPEPKPITVLDLEYEKIKSDAEGYKDKYLRLLAETENSRRRMQKERLDMMKFAVQDMVIEMLRPLDQFETALNFAEQMSDEVKNWAIGFEMILKQFKEVFTGHGVMPYNVEIGSHFDPHHHEAVEIIETEEYESGTILKEVLRGYKMGDRTIRPAHVQVSKKPEKKVEENNKENLSKENKNHDS